VTDSEPRGAAADRAASEARRASSSSARPPGRARRFAGRLRGAFALGAGPGLLVIVLSLLAIGFALHRNLRAVDQWIERILEVEEPTSAAAHELEINVLGTGLGVWKYLATGAAEHRARVAKDKADYSRFRAEYELLATTAVERDLGQRLDELYAPYAELGSGLLDTRDAFVSRLGGATAAFETIDRIIDESIQAGLERERAEDQVKLLRSTSVEADAAECLAALGAYLAVPTARNRELVDASVAEVREHLEALLALELTAREREHARDVQRFFDLAVAEIGKTVLLHESLQRDRRAFSALHERLDELLDESIQVAARAELRATRPGAKTSVQRLYLGSMAALGLGALVCIAAAALLAHRSVRLQTANRQLREQFARRQEAEAGRTQLLHRLVSVQEHERGRLARELHDQMGQDLATLLLSLKRLESSAPPAAASAAAQAEIARLQELTRRLIEQVHTIAWELRPAAIDDLGVHGALGAYLEQWSERSGLRADFASSLESQRLSGPAELALYRIAQEALTNVLKHACARNVSLTLQRRGEEIVMVIEDDGAGFSVPPHAASAGGRLGLLGMHERAGLVGGTLHVESAPGRGTTVVARIPSSAPPEVVAP
jgi:signal transduction histidine kinase